MKEVIKVMAGVMAILLMLMILMLLLQGWTNPLFFLEVFKMWALSFFIFADVVLLVGRFTKNRGLMWVGGTCVLCGIVILSWFYDSSHQSALEVREVERLYIYLLVALTASNILIRLSDCRRRWTKYQ